MGRLNSDCQPWQCAEAILAAIAEAREFGVSDEEIIEILTDIVEDLREALSQSERPTFKPTKNRRIIQCWALSR
jgi:hypothetical protein